MTVKSGQSVTVLFATANASTGAAADASSTPTGTLYVNGTSNAASVTVTNKATGVYSAAVTLPSLSAGDIVSLRIAATVATVAGEGIVWQDVSDTKRVSDLNDAAAAPTVTAIRQEMDANSTKLANMDATVSSRSTYAGADTSGTTTLLSRVVGTLAAGTHNAQSGDAYARLGAPAGASVSADVAAVKAETAAIVQDTGTDIPAALTTLGGYVDTEIAAIKAKTDQLTFTTPNKVDATASVDTAAIASAVAAAVDVPTVAEIDTQLSGTHGAGLWGGAGGTGAISTTVTITDGTNPLDGVFVKVTTDSAGANTAATGYTDAFGHATFMLDAGTYYVWKQVAGYDFTNPQTMVVS